MNFKNIITGASGFVGKNLVPYLTELGIDVVPMNLRGGKIDTLPNKCNAIIHLAGKAHDLKCVNNSSEYFAINTQLTKQLFDKFLLSEIKDFIYFSSVKAVADEVVGSLVEETTPNPKTPYGESKLKAEEYLLSKHLPFGKRLFIIRPCMIHGPGNKGNLNLLYNVIKKGIPYPLGAFKNYRSFLNIDNLLFIIDKILRNPSIPSGVYNLADDEPLPTKEVIQIIAETIGKKSIILNFPISLIKGIAQMGDVMNLPLNSERLKKLTENYIVDNTKIKNALKIKSLPISTREGLLNTIKSFKDL